MNGKWEKQTGKYAFGEDYRVGRVVVGSASHSATVSKGDPNKYDCCCLLPGIRQPANRYATLDDAKARLERMVNTWFMWTAQEHNQDAA